MADFPGDRIVLLILYILSILFLFLIGYALW